MVYLSGADRPAFVAAVGATARAPHATGNARLPNKTPLPNPARHRPFNKLRAGLAAAHGGRRHPVPSLIPGRSAPPGRVRLAVAGWLRRAAPDAVGTVVFDECFPAETLVATPGGNRPIEALWPGDPVLFYRGGQMVVRAWSERCGALSPGTWSAWCTRKGACGVAERTWSLMEGAWLKSWWAGADSLNCGYRYL